MKLQWRFAALRNGFQDATAYQIEFLFEILGSALVPAAIQYILWYALFSLGGQSQVAGMTYMDMIHYTCASLLFSQIRGGDHDFELQELIRSGQLSNYLLRPVGVVEFIYIRGVAPRLFIASLCFILGLGFSAFFGFSVLNLLLAFGMALMGNIIHYQIGAALSSTAFFWEEAYSILMVKNMIVNLLSGELIPLNLFPPSLQWIWKSTPFYFYVFGPIQIALGHWSSTEILTQFALATLWMVGGWLLIRLTWGFGMKRYLSLGG
jgi:ABC-2 type transport system permease protein